MIFLRWLHKWLGLIVGVQMTLWMLSGFAMAALSMHQIKGGDRRSEAALPALDRKVQPLAAIRQSVEGAQSVSLRHGPDGPVYHIVTPAGIALLDAYTGAPYEVTAERALAAAATDYFGPGKPVSAEPLTAPFMELRKHTGPVWRVNFDDGRHTTLYIDAVTGQVLERRNDIWRVFDVFWMLHTMDYVGRDNFNNPLVIIAGFAALWLSLSGFLLLFSSFRRRDFDIGSALRRLRGDMVISAVHAPGREVSNLSFAPGLSYFDAFARLDVNLPSSCGGAGSCGQCVIRLKTPTRPGKEELRHLSAADLEEGWRLACRHQVRDGVDVELPEGVLDNAVLSGQVSAARFIAPFIKEIRIRLDAPLRRPFVPGQYVQLLVPPGDVLVDAADVPQAWRGRWLDVPDGFESSALQEARRIYSIAIGPHENAREIVLNVRLVPPAGGGGWGRGSSYVFSLLPGDAVTLSGPYGRFGPSASATSLVLIGGGSGMAPLRSIVRHEYSAQGQKRPIRFFYGARTEADILYREEFESLAASEDSFDWIVALSDAQVCPQEWGGHRGLVHEVAGQELGAGLAVMAGAEFLLCGPPALIEASRQMLLSLGVPEGQIRCEDFGV